MLPVGRLVRQFAPDAGEPGLLLARQAGRPVIVRQLGKSSAGRVTPPAVEVVVSAVAPAVPALFIVAARIGAEQHAARLQAGAQLPQYARQLFARHVKQRGIGEYAVEISRRQVELEKVLLPHFAAAMSARHFGKARHPFETDGGVAAPDELLQIAARPAAEIEDRERRLSLDVLQQRGDVLADVVIARALPEVLRAFAVVPQSALRA